MGCSSLVRCCASASPGFSTLSTVTPRRSRGLFQSESAQVGSCGLVGGFHFSQRFLLGSAVLQKVLFLGERSIHWIQRGAQEQDPGGSALCLSTVSVAAPRELWSVRTGTLGAVALEGLCASWSSAVRGPGLTGQPWDPAVSSLLDVFKNSVGSNLD